tara:strand:+ start:397 stop:741 length:345 start_codon:yes stop_codon:yes gene_type:complete
MTWKNTLRKAPFNINEAQAKQKYALTAEKNKLLEEFPKVLEDFLDDELRSEIEKKPNSDHYIVYSEEVADEIKNLKSHGVTHQEIEKLLKDEYKAKRVVMSPDGDIKFDGVIAL